MRGSSGEESNSREAAHIHTATIVVSPGDDIWSAHSKAKEATGLREAVIELTKESMEKWQQVHDQGGGLVAIQFSIVKK